VGGAPAPPARRPGKLVAIVVAALVVLGGGAYAALRVFNAVAGTSDVLAKMVPSGADVYATAYLDPAAGQKLNLKSLAKKFSAPGGRDLSATLDQSLEEATAGTGLSYTRDIKPWLGTQLAVAAHLGGQIPEAVVLISSKDDAKAEATLRKARDRLLGESGLTWRQEDHGGVTVNIGSDPSGARQVAYAIVDHTVVLSNAGVLVDEVIDTAQGKHANLGDDDAFRDTVGGLPDELLGLAYISPSLLDKIPQLAGGGVPFAGLPTSAPSATTGIPGLGQLSAFRGMGFSLSAESNGLALDLAVALDSSKLPAPAREALEAGGHENSVIAFVPKDAYAVFALTGFDQLAQSLIDQLGTLNPEIKQTTDQIGLTTGVLSDLTGDIGLEYGPGPTQAPSGALLIGTKDEDASRRFLDRVAQFASQQSSDQSVSFTSETYKGVTIKVAQGAQVAEEGIQPSYAVTSGMGIVGSSPDAVKAVIDAHDGDNIGSAPNFADAASSVDLSNSALLYVDVEALLSRFLQPGSLPPEVETNLARLKAAVLDVSSSADTVTARVFVLIK